MFSSVKSLQHFYIAGFIVHLRDGHGAPGHRTETHALTPSARLGCRILLAHPLQPALQDFPFAPVQVLRLDAILGSREWSGADWGPERRVVVFLEVGRRFFGGMGPPGEVGEVALGSRREK